MESKTRLNQHVSMAQRSAAILSVVALLASTFAAGISAQSMKAPASKSAAKLSEDQRILHVLNRLGFGVRPGELLRQLQQRGALPADLAAARDNRVKGGANAAPNANAPKAGEAMPAEMQGPEAAKGNDPAKNNAPANNVAANPMDNPEYRKAVRDYFMENNLRPAQFLTGEL